MTDEMNPSEARAREPVKRIAGSRCARWNTTEPRYKQGYKSPRLQVAQFRGGRRRRCPHMITSTVQYSIQLTRAKEDKGPEDQKGL